MTSHWPTTIRWRFVRSFAAVSAPHGHAVSASDRRQRVTLASPGIARSCRSPADPSSVLSAEGGPTSTARHREHDGHADGDRNAVDEIVASTGHETSAARSPGSVPTISREKKECRSGKVSDRAAGPLPVVRRRDARARTLGGRRISSSPRSPGGPLAPRSGGASPVRRVDTRDDPADRCAARACASPHVRSSASRSGCGTPSTARRAPAEGTARPARVEVRRPFHRRVELCAVASVVDLSGRSYPWRGDSGCHSIGEHPVTLQVAECAVVGEDVEAVVDALEGAAGLVPSIRALTDVRRGATSCARRW